MCLSPNSWTCRARTARTPDNEDADAVSAVHYDVNIWRTKSHGIAMACPTDDSLVGAWMARNSHQDIFIGAGRQNYLCCVTRTSSLHFLCNARRASEAVNTLLSDRVALHAKPQLSLRLVPQPRRINLRPG